jgi:hypothetical protein
LVLSPVCSDISPVKTILLLVESNILLVEKNRIYLTTFNPGKNIDRLYLTIQNKVQRQMLG